MSIRYVLATGKQGVIDSSTEIDNGVIEYSDINKSAFGNGLQGGYDSGTQNSSPASVKLNEGAFPSPLGSGLQVTSSGVALSANAAARLGSFYAVHSGSVEVLHGGDDGLITPVDFANNEIQLVANTIIYIRATVTALQKTTGANGAGWMIQAVFRRPATGSAVIVDTSYVNHAFKDSGFSNVTPRVEVVNDDPNYIQVRCPASNSIDIEYRTTVEALCTIVGTV